MTVTFGNVAATNVAIIDPSHIKATTPAGSAGAVDVVVGGMATLANGYTYMATAPAAPTIGSATAGSGQATVSFTPPASTGGSPVTIYTVTSSPDGITATGSSSPITVSGLANGTAYTFSVTATNSAGTSSASFASNSVTPKGGQTIQFTNPGAQAFGTSPVLNATASSGLPVVFRSSSTNVCTVTSGGALTLVSAGTCTISAEQAGDNAYEAATTVSQSFGVNAVAPAAPIIGTATASDGQASVSFIAPANTGGSPVTGYTVTSSPGGFTATGASSPIIVTGLMNGTAYVFTVTATNSAGTGSASASSNSVTPRSSQTITFNNPGPQTFGTSPVLTAAASSSLPVTFTSSTTGICTVTSGGVLTFASTGTCTINADQAGNAAFLPAVTVSQSFTINAMVPGAPIIGTATAGDGQATVSFTAPSGTGGSPVTGYTVTSNPGGLTATGSSSPITVTGLDNGTAYTFTVTATSSAGTGPASASSNSVTPRSGQTITFNNPGAQNFGTSPTLTAVASSSLPVTFTSSTTGICTIASGGVLTFVSAGTCTINAEQAGNGAFLAAATVSQSFTVNAVVPGAPIIGAAAVGDGQATVSFMPPASAGGAAITSYAVTSNPGGFTGSGSSSPITVPGLTNGVAYTFTVTATNSVGTGDPSAASNAVTPTQAAVAPVANPVSTSVAANSPAAAIALNISGGAPTSVAIGSAPAHGTATVSGLTISYQPAAGYSGNDSFTYTATNAAGTSDAATVTINVTGPTFTFSPPAGALPAGSQGTVYAGATIVASGAAAPYSYSVTGGALPTGLTLAPNGTISGTPSVSGTFNITVTATDTNGMTGTATYSLSIGVQVPVANPVSASIPANASVTPIALNITGGTPISVAVSTPPSHGTATVSGLSMSYQPTAGYSGSDSFAYTATNAAGTSSAATVTIAVVAPTFAFSPAAGPLPAGNLAAAYNAVIAASGGTAPYSYAATSGTLPAGLSLATDGTISGTPTVGGNFNFAVMATDANGGTGTATYSLSIGIQAPVANPVSATVAANSSATAVALNITGGAPTSVAIASPPSHGTATASGLSVSYQPTAGYSGPDSFTYTATNDAGTSAPAAVTITVTPASFSFSPAAGPLPAGSRATVYNGAISASGGTAPYTYSVTAGVLPSGLTLASNGAIAGTPTASGDFSFTVTATDAAGVTSAATYSLRIEPGTMHLAFSPASGALSDAMAGENYSQPIAAAGGADPVTYSLLSGTLPQGMVLNISTGELSGPLAANTQGDYSFVVQARDRNGLTASASYTLKVKARAVTVTDKVVNVEPGASPADVYLNRGATGGPFVSADLTFVEPANAGKATIIQGQLAQAGPAAAPVGWYLQFTPNPAYSGQVRVGFRLTSGLGISNTGTVVYNLGYDVAEVEQDIDRLVHGFVRSRQNMIASTVEVPGLLERRRMEHATDPVTARMMPSENGLTIGFSTSLVQLEAAQNMSDSGDAGYSSPFNIWIDGAFLAHRNSERDNGQWGSFAMINLGADYLLSEDVLLGLSFHYDMMSDPADADTELTGRGWLGGPYASVEVGRNIFWNASLRYGGSANDIDTEFWDGSFDTTRWMGDTSIEGQWRMGNGIVVTPKLRALYFSEDVKDYDVTNEAGDTVAVKGFNEEQFRVSLGAEVARSFTLDDGAKVTPKLGFAAGFSGLDGAGLFGRMTAGLAVQTTDDWNFEASLLLNLEGSDDRSLGGRIGASKRF